MSGLEGRSRRGDGKHLNRSRSPRKDSEYDRKRQKKDNGTRDHEREHSMSLPFKSRLLSKHDLEGFRPLFAMYLDVQKEIFIEDLEEHELKGRWKSFMNKWNRGELSEGYYDPQTKAKADARAREENSRDVPGEIDTGSAPVSEHEHDSYGPSLPRNGVKSATQPGRQDLEYRNELDEDAQHAALSEDRQQRKQDRKLQKERLDDLMPRAEPGTKERQLEKKREKADSSRAFREARSPGAEEVTQGDLMGEEAAEGYKAKLQANQRRKTERELRKEEVLRARAVEREERLSQHRAKEDKTMEMLRAIAQQRYG